MACGVQISGDNDAAWQPGSHAQGLHVGDHCHIGVAGVPGGQLVALNGVVLDIDSQQVVAALCTVVGDVIYEVAGGHSLSNQAALHISEGHDYGVDFALGIKGL